MADVLGRRTFVGRGVELARLRAAFEAMAASRSGRTVVVGGEAGIGKSRLIHRFADEVRDRARVLEGACLEIAGDALPYAPFVEMLRGIVRDTPPELLPALLGPGRAELTRLLPELAMRAADLEHGPRAGTVPPGTTGPGDLERASQARLFELVLALLERLAQERPLVLVVEDAQWADRSTRELIGFLARALRDSPTLLVLALRTDASGEAVGNLAFMAELEREDDVERIELRRFDRDEVAEQAAALLPEPPPPATVDRLLARSDGNPFYVEELILAQPARDELPPVLSDVLAARVRALSPAAREILRAAAAAGRRVDDELLAAALEMPPRELAAGLREALESGILVRVETPAGPLSAFRHALLHEAVDAELFPVERAALHRAFATALEARHQAGDRSVAAMEIARHWDGAREPARALPYTLQAAAAAEQVYAFAEALRLWERAAAIMEQLPRDGGMPGRDLPEVLVRAGDCAVLIGDPQQAVGLVQRALLQVYPSGDSERVLALENRLRWHLFWSGDHATALAAVEHALAELPADPPSVARARVLAQLAGIRMFAGDLAGSAQVAQEAIALGEGLGSVQEIALAYGVLGWDLAMLGDVTGGLEEYRKGQVIAEVGGSVEGMAVAATNLAALLDRVGLSEASLQAARDGYALTERYGVARTYGGLLLGHAAKAELALGRWDDADRSTATGLRRGAVDAGALWLSINRARLLIGRGRFEEADTVLRRGRAIDQRLGGTEFRTALLAAEAELGAWTGDVNAVVQAGRAGLDLFATGVAADPSLAWLAALVVRTIADAGPEARAAAAPLLSEIERAIAAVGDRPGLASKDRAGALLALLRAERARITGESTPEAWHEVATRWANLSRPFHVAYARWREAEAILAARGDRRAAAAALRDAAGAAARLGAEPLLHSVMALAKQARIAVSAEVTPADGDDGAADPYDFTAREAEVLRLVAAGWTNQQIADHLFITRKTASVHVSNILGKLGVSNRGEAAAMAHRLGLTDETPIPGATGG